MPAIQDVESATIALPVVKAETTVGLKTIFDHLAEEGFRPKIDEDCSISFKCEGWQLYIDPYEANGGFRLYCCVHWELEPDERIKALIAANSVNSDQRCVKAIVNSKNSVWITYETHCADALEFSRTLGTAAIGIVVACRGYREAFRRESQPVTIN